MAADDEDEIMEPGEVEGEPEAEEEGADGPELDEEDLEADDEIAGFEDDEFAETPDEDDEEEASAGPVRRSVPAGDEEEDDDDIVAPDDVEADLDMILKDRLVAADDDGGNEDDEEPEDRSDPGDRLQPKRADEQLCSNCFLLVRQTAPACPIGDDDCPLFS